MSSKIYGFKVDEYFVAFPPGDFISEENGDMSVQVDIFRITKDNKKVPIPVEEITEELEIKIAAHINEMLTRAIERAEKEGK